MVERRGSKYPIFFKSMVGRRNRKKILSLKRMNGSTAESVQEVKDEAVGFFQRLLGSTCSSYSSNERREMLSEIVQKRLTDAQAAEMELEVTYDEIKNTLFSLKDMKAPGPDGYNAYFFKKSWPIIGDLVSATIQEFFTTGKLLKELNATILALVPKIPNPSTMSEFRPISCCNTIYKVISKIIASRIKRILPEIINPNQAAFIQGRIIGDNILLA